MRRGGEHSRTSLPHSDEVHESDVVLHVLLELTELFFVVVYRNHLLQESVETHVEAYGDRGYSQ